MMFPQSLKAVTAAYAAKPPGWRCSIIFYFYIYTWKAALSLDTQFLSSGPFLQGISSWNFIFVMRRLKMVLIFSDYTGASEPSGCSCRVERSLLSSSWKCLIQKIRKERAHKESSSNVLKRKKTLSWPHLVELVLGETDLCSFHINVPTPWLENLWTQSRTLALLAFEIFSMRGETDAVKGCSRWLLPLCSGLSALCKRCIF